MGGIFLEFQVKILLLSFIATVLLAIVIIPILKKLKIGQTERDDGPESHMIIIFHQIFYYR